MLFERAGFIPVQRLVADAPWEDYQPVDDVVMVPYEDASNVINLASSADNQVALSDPVTDAAGTRRSTLLFKSGTDAVMEMPDGSTQPLDVLTVRSTEYTIGPTALDAMPAQLPQTTALTYALELSVDEAVTAGAVGVRFNKPVVNYIDDFLGFPVGGDVPVGTYDRERWRVGWLPQWAGGPHPGRDGRPGAARRGRRRTGRRRREAHRPRHRRRGARRALRRCTTPVRPCGACRSSTSRPGTTTGPSGLGRTPRRRIRSGGSAATPRTTASSPPVNPTARIRPPARPRQFRAPTRP